MVSKSHHILVIDIGTTATKAVIFDSKGTPVMIVRKNYPMLTPPTGLGRTEPWDRPERCPGGHKGGLSK